ncbi:topoisomerase DNA-binding C4 zinc finger domain-containing protein [Brevibacillus borstelensis]|nr:topoisomerase DNA-binding C4 zinc finger domain-containing protein [Brevibacillus borstelensis]
MSSTGYGDESKFIGCSNYPSCKFTLKNRA